MSNIKILTCIHKNDIYLKDKNYLPIHVGKALSKTDLGIQGDDTGDNISTKNPNYCELTAMYWAWKNLKDADYIGLCHYRRYFDFHNQCKKGFPYTVFATSEHVNIDISIPEKIIKKLEEGYVVVPKSNTMNHALFYDYCTYHVSDDIRTVEAVIKEKCDSKYIEAFEHVMYRNNKLIPYNMFIMSREEYDKYCKWLFDILNAVESRTNIENYSPFQKRIYGFMAERLFNVYLYAEKMKTIKKAVIFFNDNDNTEKVSYLKFKYRNMLKNISLMFSMAPKYWFKRH